MGELFHFINVDKRCTTFMGKHMAFTTVPDLEKALLLMRLAPSTLKFKAVAVSTESPVSVCSRP
jgi:hypothetical protein